MLFDLELILRETRKENRRYVERQRDNPPSGFLRKLLDVSSVFTYLHRVLSLLVFLGDASDETVADVAAWCAIDPDALEQLPEGDCLVGIETNAQRWDYWFVVDRKATAKASE